MGKTVVKASHGWYFTSKTYDFLNDVVKLVLPALGVFYSAMALIWGWDYAEAVVGTLAALAVLGGVLLAVSKKYWLQDEANVDGELLVNTTDPRKDSITLAMKQLDPEVIKNQSMVTLRVEDTSSR